MQRITVFCGSSEGSEPIYKQQAIQLGETMASKGIGLVYGGARIGIMGAVAQGVLSRQGEVIGVIPHFLDKKEVAHEELSQLIRVETMHERKMKMHELSDGVIALPGGFGTLDELFEILTWAQLGLHGHPIGILNTNGFYDHLLGFIENLLEKGFIKQLHKDMVLVSDNMEDLLVQMEAYVPPLIDKWVTRETI